VFEKQIVFCDAFLFRFDYKTYIKDLLFYP
jgi:hypothetical protein